MCLVYKFPVTIQTFKVNAQPPHFFILLSRWNEHFSKKIFFLPFSYERKKYIYTNIPHCSYYKKKYLHLELQHSRWASQFPNKSLRMYPALEYYWTHQTRGVSLLGFLEVSRFKFTMIQLFQVLEELFTSLQLLADVFKKSYCLMDLLSPGSVSSYHSVTPLAMSICESSKITMPMSFLCLEWNILLFLTDTSNFLVFASSSDTSNSNFSSKEGLTVLFLTCVFLRCLQVWSGSKYIRTYESVPFSLQGNRFLQVWTKTTSLFLIVA